LQILFKNYNVICIQQSLFKLPSSNASLKIKSFKVVRADIVQEDTGACVFLGIQVGFRRFPIDGFSSKW